MTGSAILWRRLDTPGHDACRLLGLRDGWRLTGAAAFRHETGSPACVTYAVDCDAAWRTRKGVVHGWVGAEPFELSIRRTAGGAWRVNGAGVPGLQDCLDLDLGFTPSTNLFQLRRAALEIGEAADVPVAWLDVPAGTLERVAQRYERRAADRYWYEAPRFGYSALLRVGAAGFVEEYPTLWEIASGG